MFRNFSKSTRANILVGFFLTLPVATTLLIAYFVFNLATNWVSDEWFTALREAPGGDLLLQFLTLLTLVLVFYVVGLLTRNFFGKRLLRLSDTLLTKIPFVKTIYLSVRQISESLFTQRKTLFKEVVLIEYPRKGLHCLAFVTAPVPRNVARHICGPEAEGDCVSLFLPTTPNPTSGFFLLVPRSDVIPLNIPVTEGLTFIMSAGAVPPGEEGSMPPTLLDKLESWLRKEIDSSPEETDAPAAKK